MIHPRQIVRFVQYAGVFLKELAVANYQVVKMVIAPELRIKPGFITVPMDAKTDFEVTSLANSITLTPGTISVHVPHEREAIVIHAIDIGDDPDEVRRAIKETLETGILNWTRPEGYEYTPAANDAQPESNDATESTEIENPNEQQPSDSDS